MTGIWCDLLSGSRDFKAYFQDNHLCQMVGLNLSILRNESNLTLSWKSKGYYFSFDERNGS